MLDSDKFSEISLDQSVDVDQAFSPPTQQDYNPLQNLDTFATPQSDERPRDDTLFNPLAQATAIKESLSQLPGVASSVLSSFSSILKGSASPNPSEKESYSSPDTNLYGAQSVQSEQTETSNPYQYYYDQSVQQLPSEPIVPTFYSPNDPTIARPEASLSPSSTDSQGNNLYRLKERKKHYAPIPGFNANNPLNIPSASVSHEPLPPATSTDQSKANNSFSLTSFFGAPLLDKIQSTVLPKAPDNAQSSFGSVHSQSDAPIGITTSGTPPIFYNNSTQDQFNQTTSHSIPSTQYLFDQSNPIASTQIGFGSNLTSQASQNQPFVPLPPTNNFNLTPFQSAPAANTTVESNFQQPSAPPLTPSQSPALVSAQQTSISSSYLPPSVSNTPPIAQTATPPIGQIQPNYRLQGKPLYKKPTQSATNLYNPLSQQVSQQPTQTQFFNPTPISTSPNLHIFNPLTFSNQTTTDTAAAAVAIPQNDLNIQSSLSSYSEQTNQSVTENIVSPPPVSIVQSQIQFNPDQLQSDKVDTQSTLTSQSNLPSIAPPPLTTSNITVFNPFSKQQQSTSETHLPSVQPNTEYNQLLNPVVPEIEATIDPQITVTEQKIHESIALPPLATSNTTVFDQFNKNQQLTSEIPLSSVQNNTKVEPTSQNTFSEEQKPCVVAPPPLATSNISIFNPFSKQQQVKSEIQLPSASFTPQFDTPVVSISTEQIISTSIDPPPLATSNITVFNPFSKKQQVKSETQLSSSQQITEYSHLLSPIASQTDAQVDSLITTSTEQQKPESIVPCPIVTSNIAVFDQFTSNQEATNEPLLTNVLNNAVVESSVQNIPVEEQKSSVIAPPPPPPPLATSNTTTFNPFSRNQQASSQKPLPITQPNTEYRVTKSPFDSFFGADNTTASTFSVFTPNLDEPPSNIAANKPQQQQPTLTEAIFENKSQIDKLPTEATFEQTPISSNIFESTPFDPIQQTQSHINNNITDLTDSNQASDNATAEIDSLLVDGENNIVEETKTTTIKSETITTTETIDPISFFNNNISETIPASTGNDLQIQNFFNNPPPLSDVQENVQDKNFDFIGTNLLNKRIERIARAANISSSGIDQETLSVTSLIAEPASSAQSEISEYAFAEQTQATELAPTESQQNNKVSLVSFINSKCLFDIRDKFILKNELLLKMNDRIKPTV